MCKICNAGDIKCHVKRQREICFHTWRDANVGTQELSGRWHER